MDPVADVIDKLALVQLDGAGAEYDAAQKLYAFALWTTLAVSAAAVAIAALAGLSLIRSITAGLAVAVKVAAPSRRAISARASSSTAATTSACCWARSRK